MKKCVYIVFLMILASSSMSFGQVTPCNCTASVSGTQNFSALTWTGTGCPTAVSTLYTGNLCVNIPNNANLIMDKNFTVNGGFGISTSGANPNFTIPTGITLNVSGDMGDDNNNNAKFAISGVLNVGGTLFGKNNNNFSGNGSITAGGVDFGNGTTCTSPGCTINWDVTVCDGPAAFCTTVLPVTLLFFEANAYPEYVELKWATASELNFDRFVIEKTRDGKTFIEVGERQGAGISTSRIDYSFEDEQIILGKTYYRLKAIDFDGYIEYFGLVSVYYDGVDEIGIFPNPVTNGDVNIYFNYFNENPVFYKVMDVSGKEVIAGSIQRTGFDSQFTLSNHLAAGMYYFVVSHEKENKVIRFVVL